MAASNNPSSVKPLPLPPLPIGIKFLPTDQELVGHYLLKKVAGEVEPGGHVRDCDVYGQHDPWQIWRGFGGGEANCVNTFELPKIWSETIEISDDEDDDDEGDVGSVDEEEDSSENDDDDDDYEELYFFTKLKPDTASAGEDRKVGSGRWIGEDQGTKIWGDVVDSSMGKKKLIGAKRRFRYEFNGGAPPPEMTEARWIMLEYSLDASLFPPSVSREDNYVICVLRKLKI